MDSDLSPINKPIQPPAPKPSVATPPQPSLDPVAPLPESAVQVNGINEQTPPSTPLISKIQSPVPPATKPAPKISTIRTFRGDVSAGVQGGSVTLTSIALANQQARKDIPAPDTQKASGTRKLAPAIAIAIGILLIGAGSYLLFSSRNQNTAAPAGITVIPPSIIFAENTTVIDTTQTPSLDALKNRITNEMSASSPKSGKVLALAFTAGQGPETRLLTAQEFFSVMTPSMPANLNRSLEDDFLFGIYYHEKNEPFIMLENDSYENSFAGMLAWEEQLAQDILPLFGRRSELRTTRVSNWKDKVIRNIDTRIETDENGTVQLIYSFINRKTLVIASSEIGFIEALTRFHTPKPVTR